MWGSLGKLCAPLFVPEVRGCMCVHEHILDGGIREPDPEQTQRRCSWKGRGADSRQGEVMTGQDKMSRAGLPRW